MDGPRPAAPEPRRILIIKPSSLGDVVHALPVLAAARATYPRAHLAWLISASFAPLLAGHPLLDEVIPFDRRRFGRMLRDPRTLAEFARFVRDLRHRRFDLVLDLQGLFRSGFLAWATGARRRVGFRAARELAWAFYTCRVVPPAGDTHAVQRNVALARAAGLRLDTPAFPLGLRPDELDRARALLATTAGRDLPTFVAVVPGARWPSKQWPAERFAELIDALHAAGRPPVVLLGSPDERPLAAAILRVVHAPVIDLCGRTDVRTLAAVLALAAQVICCDSGPMHIAAALGTPIVAVFGPTSPARTGPYAAGAQIVSRALPCAPCYARRCPLGHHACLRGLTAAVVLDAVRQSSRPPK